MNRKRLLPLLGFLLTATVMAQRPKSPAFPQLEAEWAFVENNFQGKADCRADLVLTNKSKSTLGAAGWEIYFTSPRALRVIGDDAPVAISHVNGDVFKITPNSRFKGLAQGASLTIPHTADGKVLNNSSGPDGFFILSTTDRTKKQSIKLSFKPFGPEAIGGVTNEVVYQRNMGITELPDNQLVPVFPSPRSYSAGQGVFAADASTVIHTDPAFANEADQLAEAIGKFTGRKLQVISGIGQAANAIRLTKQPMPAEAYQLSISPNGILVKAGDAAGAFYAVQTLRSLVPSPAAAKIAAQFSFPAMEVSDQPRFGYRSFMLDVSRNFQTPTKLLKVIDLMAFLKLNVLHLHFIDDEAWRLEIPGLPELTNIGSQRGILKDSNASLLPSYASGPDAGKLPGSGYYTRAEFINILKYARDRHVQIIPEFESPGHSRAAIKSMEERYKRLIAEDEMEAAEEFLLNDLDDKSVYSSAQAWNDNVMCPALPSTYRFIGKVVDEIVKMYKEAGAPLTTIHMGGDEVPAGVWEGSPICQKMVGKLPGVKEIDDYWYYFYGKVDSILKGHGLFTSGWEEMAMRKTKLDGNKFFIPNPGFANNGMQVHVWNNMVGWGAEDLPYKLANAGYKVVLSPVSNNYLDMAYMKHPDEPGYYWGGFVDIDKPFRFNPFDYYKTTREDAAGSPFDPVNLKGKERLTEYGQSNIVGVQGLLWAENLRTPDRLEYLMLPKLIGIAERAWAPTPAWALEADKVKMEEQYSSSWNQFVNVVGKKVLPALDHLNGGYGYRIPTAGLKVEGGAIHANVQFPGMPIRYTKDGSEPSANSPAYTKPITEKGNYRFRVFNALGRGGRTVAAELQ
ncbi:carbohydate-binding domain-containing protein [Flavihumibacter rivuli]|uniref:family 20 glycosylhydrolase n=1 Tax=Flavihumibacter rivuli TaxID=2838156 RepID=UPI001BDE0EF2|nr:family 20 glycosylhydrolase [Flavihumibacter rivuli]ULQ57017.1 carbohydate-binding domain-containing protein [Flavihumibacter rivuli]